MFAIALLLVVMYNVKTSKSIGNLYMYSIVNYMQFIQTTKYNTINKTQYRSITFFIMFSINRYKKKDL